MKFVTLRVTIWLFEQAPSVGVSETVSALSDLLNSKPVTAKQAAAKADEKGIHLPYGTIAAYWSGSHGRPSPKTLSALAQVVPFTEKQLQQAAWSKTTRLGPWVPPQESVLLDRATRKALDALIKSVVAAKGEFDVVETSQESSAPSEESEDEKRSADDAQALPGVERVEAHFDPEAVGVKQPDDGQDKRA